LAFGILGLFLELPDKLICEGRQQLGRH
jgi:hypothetical protein